MIRILFLTLMLLLGCAGPTPITKIDPMIVGEATFFPTIAAHTDAPIIGGNKIDVLLNGEQTFPAMLKAIRGSA